jgi:hypothetical protein
MRCLLPHLRNLKHEEPEFEVIVFDTQSEALQELKNQPAGHLRLTGGCHATGARRSVGG